MIAAIMSHLFNSDSGVQSATDPEAPHSEVGVYLYWIPLGAGGSGFVRMNGRIYETIKAFLEQRPPDDLYHTALEVRLPEDRFIVETMWPSPDGDTENRGVVHEGPVFSHWMSFTRLFRYEVRCWQDGILPDADSAIDGPKVLSGDLESAQRLLGLVDTVPSLTWGRDQTAVGDMWNSNSVISWLLTRSGFPMETVKPPIGGRAPGWESGIVVALREQSAETKGRTLR